MAREIKDRSEMISPITLVFPPDREKYSSTFVFELMEFTVERKRGKLRSVAESVIDATTEQLDEVVSDLADLVVADPRLGDYLDSKVIDTLVGFLNKEQESAEKIFKTQYYSTLVLANIVCSKKIGSEVRDKAIPSLLTLVPSRDTFVKVQALVTLTNIADEFRDSCSTMIELGVFGLLDNLFEDELAHYAALKRAGELLVAFCLADLPSSRVETLVSLVRKGLHLEYMASLKPICLALSILSDKQLVATGTEFPRLLRLIHYGGHGAHHIAYSALWTIGNYVRRGNEGEIESMIGQTLLTGCAQMLSHEYAVLRKEACWIVSNITAVANHKQIQIAMDMFVIRLLVKRLKEDEFDVQEVAALAISNAIIGSSKEQLVRFKGEYLPLVDEVRASFGENSSVGQLCSTIRQNCE